MNPNHSYNEIIKLSALLASKYNSFYQYPYKFKSFISEDEHELLIINQFVSPDKKHISEPVKVACWQVSPADLQHTVANLKRVKIYNASENLKTQETKFDFYFPIDLSDEYPGFLESMGKPEHIFEAIMSNSGRSMWIMRDNELSVCLKIDTMQLNNKKYFSERMLYEFALEHSVKISHHLKNESNIFFEDTGFVIDFNYLDSDGRNKSYIGLIRSLDPVRSEIQPMDMILPVTALASVDFWHNHELVKNLNLVHEKSNFFLNELTHCFADLIRNSINRTFFHFEVHMQNLSVHFRNGQAQKIIYHDLQDVLFDPTAYLLFHLNHIKPTSLEADMERTLKHFYDKILDLLWTGTLNPQGQLIKTKPGWRELFNVVSFYRRYLRNLGDYSKICNLFNDDEFIFTDKFEKKILEDLAFDQAELSLNELPELNDFLKNDLFWNIHRYLLVQQRGLLKKNIDYLFNPILIKKNELQKNYFLDILKNRKIITSMDFPSHYEHVQPDLIDKIYNLYENKIILFSYNDRPVIALTFDP